MLDMKYFDVYYFCHLANNSIDKFDYAGTYAEFFDGEFEVTPENFPKVSILRQFAFWWVERVIYEQARTAPQDDKYDFNPASWLEQAIKKYKNKTVSFAGFCVEKNINTEDYLETFNCFVEYLNDENDNLYFDVIWDIASEVEYILIQNREFLLNFNEHTTIYFQDHPLQRCYIPEWVKRAVLFRDKGCCVFCKKDLTGLYSLLDDKEKQFDHIVSLDEGGINDVCNIQLCCQRCNNKKSASSSTSSLYHNAY